MLPPIAPFLSKKRMLREKMKAARREAAAARPDAALHAARNFIASVPLPEDALVSLYYPLHDELDPGPLAEALAERGQPLSLPVVTGKRAPLIFRRWIPGEDLETGAFGALIPPEGAPVVSPDIIVTPLLAFTRAGGRLGYGGGYYDRTLAALRFSRPVVAVGFAYGAQEVDALPLARLDQPLDWVVTERETIRCARDAKGQG